MSSSNSSIPQRVLMTTDTVGGIWNYALALSEGLGQHAVKVVLATMGRPLSPYQRLEAERLTNVDVAEGSFKLEWMRDPWDDIACAGDWLTELEWQFAPDVIHLSSYAFGSLPWRAPVLVTGHSCVLSWWEAIKPEPAPQEWQRYRKEVRRGLQSADVVTAPSRHMLSALERHYGPLRGTRVVPNGVNPDAFNPAKKEPFVLSVGRVWDEAKNIAALQDVAPQIGWPVHIAGDTAHPDGPRAQGENVRFLGVMPSSELASWYSRASIYCLPARYEPFGLSVLEAALSGCALVLGDIPSLREFWDGVALFVPSEDTQALKNAISGLIKDESLRASIAARARERGLGLTSDRMAANYMEIYRELIANRSATPAG